MVEFLNISIAEKFEEVTSNIIVLYATKADAQRIFAASSDLTHRGKVWIVNEDASKANNVPDGVIASRLSQTPLSALRNSFTIVKHGLKFLNDLNETISPPTTCSKKAVDSNWTENHGPQFLSLHGNDLLLEEDKIHWSGGTEKPLEITLPKHLRAVTIHDPPFVYITPIISLSECKNVGTVDVELSARDTIPVVGSGPWYPCPRYGHNYTQHFCCAGYAIDLLSNLSLPEMNNSNNTSFTFSLHLNDSYGSVLLSEEGYVLTGALGELDSDMADISIGGMTINPERERYIDFSEPWLYHGIKILEKSIPRDSPMQSFLQPLKSSLWIALLVSVIMVGMAIFYLDLKSPFDRFYNVGIVWCGFCMIMVASYTANLAAFLVLDQPEKGLTGVTDPRVSDAIEALINGSLDAFIWDSTRLDFETAQHCELRTRGALFGRSAYGVGLQKNSPWTPHITSAILRMTESGMMENLDAKWIENRGSRCAVEVHKSPARLGLMNMKDVFILVTGGVAAGALFSVIEVTRERALALRYAEKWRSISGRQRKPTLYNLSRPVIRRGWRLSSSQVARRSTAFNIRLS
uniref:PBPe domain-containing protein n=1 Tax=Heterorhabditis bacteriophora TaxID=37862 RepID=A0A1I7X8S9_HETBA